MTKPALVTGLFKNRVAAESAVHAIRNEVIHAMILAS